MAHFSLRPRFALTVGLTTFVLAGTSLIKPVSAQIVRGQVVDSLTQAPVGASAVILLDADGDEIKRTSTDPEGLFLIRSPHAGRFSLRVEADDFRMSAFPPFDLASDQMLGFRLLVASLTPTPQPIDSAVLQLVERACGENPPAGPVILGRVADGVTDEPVSEADVVMTWPEIPEFLQEQAGYENSMGTALTGSTGYYAICGAPVGTKIVIHAERDGRLSRLSSITFDQNGAFVRDSFYRMETPVFPMDFSLLPGSELTASLRGTVLDTAGARLANARISVIGTTMQTRANLLGDFQLTDLPPGTIRLSVEQVGYRPTQTDIELEAGQALSLSADMITLARAPVQLDPIRVEADRPRRRRNLEEFEKRRNTTVGSFLTREEWERMGAVDETVDVLRRMRGLRIVPGRSMAQPYIITSNRSGGRGGLNSPLAGGQCYPLVFLDRRYLGNTGRMSVDREIRLSDLEAVEFHSSTAGMPAEFNRNGAVCGVLVFWTR